MRTLLCALILLLLALPAQAQDYSAAVNGLDKSILRVVIAKGGHSGICSSVVFAIKDGVAYALTAAHCVEHQPNEHIDITVADRNAEALAFNRILDLAIVKFRPAKETVTLLLAPNTPAAGTPVIASGYAFGVEGIVHQFGYVAQAYNRETKSLWLNMDVIFGDSGGAILDTQRRLVGITSYITAAGPAHLGGAVPIEAVQDFVDEFLDKLAKDTKKP